MTRGPDWTLLALTKSSYAWLSNKFQDGESSETFFPSQGSNRTLEWALHGSSDLLH